MREEDRRLHVACGYDVDSRSYVKPDADAVRRALASGVDINCRDRTGTSALGHAAWHGDEDVLTLLLEADADVEAENIDGASPLQMTVFNNKPMATALLLVYGADAGEAVEDAESMGKAEVIAVFRAWENDAHHMLLKRASQRIMTLRQKCLKQAAASPPLLVNIDHLETTLRKAVDAGVPGQLTSAARAKLNLAEREQGREKLACLSELSLLEMDIGSLGSTLRRSHSLPPTAPFKGHPELSSLLCLATGPPGLAYPLTVRRSRSCGTRWPTKPWPWREPTATSFSWMPISCAETRRSTFSRSRCHLIPGPPRHPLSLSACLLCGEREVCLTS
jgi:hypothetical protein